MSNAASPCGAPSSTDVLAVRDLSTRFFTESGQVNAVESVSFDLREDEILGVVGESGSGKSVGINAMILGFLEHVHFMHEPGNPTPWLGEIGDKWLWSEMTSRIAVEGWDPQEALDDFEAQVIEIKEKYEEQQG